MTKKEMQLELWKAMHGMDNSDAVFKRYTGSGYEIFSGNL